MHASPSAAVRAAATVALMRLTPGMTLRSDAAIYLPGDGDTSAADEASDEVDSSLVIHVDTEDCRDATEHPQLHRQEDCGVRNWDWRCADTCRGDAGGCDDRPGLVGLQANH